MALLLPVMADTEFPPDAVDVLAAALHALGAHRQPRRLARLLLDHQGLWGPQPWRMVDGARISEAPRYATRSPQVLPMATLVEITLAFAGTAPPS
jgi:hypothetical protein